MLFKYTTAQDKILLITVIVLGFELERMGHLKI